MGDNDIKWTWPGMWSQNGSTHEVDIIYYIEHNNFEMSLMNMIWEIFGIS